MPVNLNLTDRVFLELILLSNDFIIGMFPNISQGLTDFIQLVDDFLTIVPRAHLILEYVFYFIPVAYLTPIFGVVIVIWVIRCAAAIWHLIP